ncbi:MAG: sarcosine oxidase subunit delta [Planktomarina sp.]
MKITCPHCGPRSIREFTYKGASDYLDRPDVDAGDQAWDDYLHNRANPAGRTRDLWHHGLGCGAWVVVTRCTVTHEVFETQLASARNTA